MTDPNPRAVMGDNKPPPYDAKTLAELEAKVSEFNDAAGEFWAHGEIENAGQAAKCNDLIEGIRKLKNKIDDERVAQKRPWLDLAEEVDRAFNRLLYRLKEILKAPTKMQTEWLRAEERRKRAKKIAEQERRRKEQAEAAQQAANATARYDAASKSDAKLRMKELAQEEKKAAKAPVKAVAESATGGARRQSLKIRKIGKIIAYMKVLSHYKGDPLIREALQKCVDRDVRARNVDETTIPGIEISEVESLT